jgi:negative regulator of sigma E activity
MMHHREKKTRTAFWAAVQFTAWAAVMLAVLLLVISCKAKTDPAPTPSVVHATYSPGPCRCADRPWLGHEGN